MVDKIYISLFTNISYIISYMENNKKNLTDAEIKVEQVSHLEQAEMVDLCTDSSSSCDD